MSNIDRIINEHLLWNGDPTTEPEGDIDAIIDDYETQREQEQDDRR